MTYPLYPADPTRDPAEPFRKLETAPTTIVTTAEPASQGAWDELVDAGPLTAEAAVERQREVFGGPKVGSAFFGWLTATALLAILSGVIAGADAALGFGLIPDPWASGGIGPVDAVAVGWVAVGTLLAVVLVSYFAGGYVAGRMARFSGAVQGLVVWVWAIVVGIVGGIVGALADGRYGFLGAALESVPSIPVPEDLRTTAWVLAGVAVAIASLGGAVLGGAAGVRYHRRVDRVGLDG